MKEIIRKILTEDRQQKLIDHVLNDLYSRIEYTGETTKRHGEWYLFDGKKISSWTLTTKMVELLRVYGLSNEEQRYVYTRVMDRLHK